MRTRLALGGGILLIMAALAAASPPSAGASVCDLVGAATPLPVSPCSVVHHVGSILHTGTALASGNVGGVVQSVADGTASIALGAVASWATAGARFALAETAHLISATTSPSLAAPWFTTVYWRFAGVAVLLTLPFLFAAALQALIRSDLSLLARSAFGYLPLAMLGVGVAAQLTAFLLAATDELCTAVSGVAGNPAPIFLTRAGGYIAGLSFESVSPFLAVLVSAFTVAGAIVLWLELVMRAAAVYVIVVMLPLAFAALVWPARRVWALRAVELLVALILSKLAIVAVLTLGAAALEHDHTAAAFLTGLTLLVLGAFSPWAMLRFIPFAELAAGAAGRLRSEALAPAQSAWQRGEWAAMRGHDWASDVTARMRREAENGRSHTGPDIQLGALARGSGLGAATSTAGSASDASGAAAPGGPDPRAEVLAAAAGGERRVALLPDEVGPNGERRPGMAARWQAEDKSWTLHLGREDGWEPVAWRESGRCPTAPEGVPSPPSSTPDALMETSGARDDGAPPPTSPPDGGSAPTEAEPRDERL